MEGLFSIAKVSAQTGISKEVLRKWEDRYQFPVPVRDAAGVRAYTEAQLKRLGLVKRLLDAGMRPGQVVPLDEHALQELIERSQQPCQAEGAAAGKPRPPIVAWLQARDPELLDRNLRELVGTHGLGHFVRELMPAMNLLVGHAWETGEIAVRDEHLYSEVVQGLVRQALGALEQPRGGPRVLLTTVPGEAHTLGILMLEAALSLEDATCISLGPQSPLDQIVLAATDFRVDIVGLSFSTAFPKKKIDPPLRELRAQLPEGTLLWAGGSGVTGLERTPRGVTLLAGLDDACLALNKLSKKLNPGGTQE